MILLVLLLIAIATVAGLTLAHALRQGVPGQGCLGGWEKSNGVMEGDGSLCAEARPRFCNLIVPVGEEGR